MARFYGATSWLLMSLAATFLVVGALAVPEQSAYGEESIPPPPPQPMCDEGTNCNSSCRLETVCEDGICPTVYCGSNCGCQLKGELLVPPNRCGCKPSI